MHAGDRNASERTHLPIGACVCVGLLARHSAQFLLNSACLSVESIAFCAVFNKEIAEDAELVLAVPMWKIKNESNLGTTC